MTVSFNIEYRTSWGEEVRIAGLLPESIPMHTTDGIYWTADVELEVPKEGMTINYSYQIEQNQIIIRKEWDSFPRRLFLSGNSKKKYQIKDCWKNIPEESIYDVSSGLSEKQLEVLLGMGIIDLKDIPEGFLKNTDQEAFYVEISQALWGYLSDKFFIPLSELSIESVHEALLKKMSERKSFNSLSKP